VKKNDKTGLNKTIPAKLSLNSYTLNIFSILIKFFNVKNKNKLFLEFL
jgi:hypothetical protein